MLTVVAILLKAVTIALLLKIAWTDLEKQKIANRDVLAVGTAGLGSLVLASWESGSWNSVQIGAIAGFVLFLSLFPFWLLHKIGAGDVKLMGVAPLIAGGDHLLIFALALLSFALLTFLAVKNPMLLPEMAFRKYAQLLERRNIVPFGVPISLALILVQLVQFGASR